MNFTPYSFFSSKYDNEPEYVHIKYDNQSTKYDLEVRSTRMLVESTIMGSTIEFLQSTMCWLAVRYRMLAVRFFFMGNIRGIISFFI